MLYLTPDKWSNKEENSIYLKELIEHINNYLSGNKFIITVDDKVDPEDLIACFEEIISVIKSLNTLITESNGNLPLSLEDDEEEKEEEEEEVSASIEVIEMEYKIQKLYEKRFLN